MSTSFTQCLTQMNSFRLVNRSLPGLENTAIVAYVRNHSFPEQKERLREHSIGGEKKQTSQPASCNREVSAVRAPRWSEGTALNGRIVPTEWASGFDRGRVYPRDLRDDYKCEKEDGRTTDPKRSGRL
uniref:Uncharacterized protein n=1 Tax=Erpetoichthys calabaricus TaxID=27687 RepID=A0A8C4S6D1_ERPCA